MRDLPHTYLVFSPWRLLLAIAFILFVRGWFECNCLRTLLLKDGGIKTLSLNIKQESITERAFRRLYRSSNSSWTGGAGHCFYTWFIAFLMTASSDDSWCISSAVTGMFRMGSARILRISLSMDILAKTLSSICVWWLVFIFVHRPFFLSLKEWLTIARMWNARYFRLQWLFILHTIIERNHWTQSANDPTWSKWQLVFF